MLDIIPPLLRLACDGLLGYVVLFVLWKKGSARWANWFPLFQKAAQIILWILAIGVILYGLGVLAEKDVIFQQGLIAFCFGAGILPLVNQFGDKKKADRHERGASVASSAKVRAMIKKEKLGYDLVWGKVPIPHKAEPYHILVAGSTGAGKSVAITELLDTIRKRGDTALIVDSGGEFMSRLWREKTDYMLNPFDSRCVPWSPTADLEGPWDAESLARSIIPDGTGESKEWNGYAQTFLTSCLQALFEKNKKSLSDLLYVVQVAPIAELVELLAGTPAAAQLTSDKTFGSIRTIASKYMSAYNYLQSSEKPFSVSKFIKETKDGFLFLTYRDDQLDSLRNLISCVLDISARTILSLEPNSTRRVWLVIDEFASIGKVQSIETVATKARKVGGCLVIGIQSISQLKESYGEHSAQSILSCLSSWLVLRCADADTAEYMSKYLGEEEVVRTSGGSSTSESGGSTSWSEQTATQRIVLASEIQKLPNVVGFLKIAGHYPVCEITLDFPPRKEKAAATFEMRNYEKNPMIKLKAPVVTGEPNGNSPIAAAEQVAAPEMPKRTILLRRTQVPPNPIS